MGHALRVDAHLQPRIAVEGLTFEAGSDTQSPPVAIVPLLAPGGLFTAQHQ